MAHDKTGRSLNRGDLTWSNRSTDDRPNRELTQLVRRLINWPANGFAKKWFPGDYRLLTLVCTLPGDTDAIITCHSEPVSDTIAVNFSAFVRSTGTPRALDPSERERAVANGLSPSDTGAAFRTFPRDMDSIRTVVEGIGFTVNLVFGPYTTTARYELNRGSRLDQMRVFVDIRIRELLSLLRAAGFDGTPNPDVDLDSEESAFVIVRSPQPFLIELLERQGNSSFLTLSFSALLDRAFPTDAVHELNRTLPVGAASPTDDGRLMLRFRLCVTGGISAASVRDRVDEWVVSNLAEFDGKALVSVAKGGLDLGKLEDDAEKKAQEKDADEFKALTEKIAGALGERVKEVRVTHRLTDSPACLVADEHDVSGNLARILKAAGQNAPGVRRRARRCSRARRSVPRQRKPGHS